MADKKISEFGQAPSAIGTDIIPIVQAGVNKKITVDALCQSLPKVKNTGILTNAIGNVTETEIPINKALGKLTLSNHTLAVGESGQEITLIGSGSNVIALVGQSFTSVTFPTAGQTVTLVSDGTTWFVKSHFSVLFA